MQIIFKTSYDQDINVLSKTGEYIRVSTVILLLLAAPPVPRCLLPVRTRLSSRLRDCRHWPYDTDGLYQVRFRSAMPAFLGIGAYCHSILLTTGLAVQRVARDHDSIYGAGWHDDWPVGIENARLLTWLSRHLRFLSLLKRSLVNGQT